MRVFFLTIFLLLFFVSCSEKKKDNPAKAEKNIVVKPKKANKEITKKKAIEAVETINRKNTIAFLTDYGKKNPETIVLFKTRLGDLKIKLYKDTPLHRASFIFLTKQGYFSTTCVHRIVEDFVVQGGNSENAKTRSMRRKFESYTLPAEFRSNRTHKYGALAAARDWEKNPTKKSTPFEFYFITAKNGGHHLDGEHTVFGELISGFDTLEKIANVKVGNDQWPIIDVYFKAEVIR